MLTELRKNVEQLMPALAGFAKNRGGEEGSTIGRPGR